MKKKKISVFDVVNNSILLLVAISCILPFIHVIAVSLSAKSSVVSGAVYLLPVNITFYPYEYVITRPQFWTAFLVSIKRVLLGVTLQVLMTIIIGYPLSKEPQKFTGRTAYAWFFFFTMLFGGGLIPFYVLLNDLNLLDKIWALVLPGAVPVFNVILMLNFFRQVPKEMEEAAYIDGAGHWRILWQIYVPVSLAAIATMTLFSVVGHWNAWFDGLIFMNHTRNYPLQSYLRTVIISMASIDLADKDWRVLLMSEENQRSAQIIVATIPILMIYPFLQRYFVTGIVMGSVKG